MFISRFKFILSIFLAVLLSSTLVFSQTAHDYKIDTSHSAISFIVKHLGLSKVRGNFESFSGTLTWDQEKAKNSTFTGIVKVATIKTGIEKRDSHLKSNDFFNASEFPTITLESKNISKNEDGSFNVKANLTIKDVTKKIEFPLNFIGETEGPYGKKRIALEANFSINRFDYGIEWKNKLANGTLIVSDKVDIILEIQAIQK